MTWAHRCAERIDGSPGRDLASAHPALRVSAGAGHRERVAPGTRGPITLREESLMLPDHLQDDCASCAGLCCIALAFDRGPSFAADKEAGERCQHLNRDDRCAIHASRARRGYRGCIGFTCYGAGQRVSQECLGGDGLAGEGAALRLGIEVFRDTRTLHEWLVLLHQAAALPLSSLQRGDNEALLAALTPPGPLEAVWLRGVVTAATRARITAHLQGLRDLIASRITPADPIPAQRAASGRL